MHSQRVKEKFFACIQAMLLMPKLRKEALEGTGLPESEVLPFVKNSEFLPKCLNNLYAEVDNYERKFPGGKQTGRHINEIIAAVSQMFFTQIVEQRRQANLSDVAKAELRQPAQEVEAARSNVKEETRVVTLGQGGDAAQQEAGPEAEAD